MGLIKKLGPSWFQEIEYEFKTCYLVISEIAKNITNNTLFENLLVFALFSYLENFQISMNTIIDENFD